MSLPYLLLLNVVGLYVSGITLTGAASAILDRKIPAPKRFTALIFYAVIYSLLSSLISLRDLQQARVLGLLSMIGVSVLDIIIDLCFLKYFFSDLKKMQLLFVLALISPFAYFGVTASTYTLQLLWPESIQITLLEHLASVVTMLIYTLLLIKLLQKTRAFYYLRRLIRYPVIYISLGIVHFILNVSINLYVGIAGFSWMIILGLVIIMGTAALVREFTNRDTIRDSQALIMQQQNYVTRLERHQKELRLLQHDYKNMVAGMYAQASEGNAEAVKDYIETKLLKIDASMQDDIQQVNQLIQIEVTELKSLILTKLLQAEQQNVTVRLEVINPVDEVFLEIGDLLRCVGILLDNAIEEAARHPNGQVALILIQEESQFTVIVKNPITHQPDMVRIWQNGYSTKGEKRGLGLTSYRNILSEYNNVFKETKIEDRTFIQIFGAMKEA